MDQSTKDIVSKQTGIDDMLLIEKVFFECNSDVGSCILTLMDIKFETKPEPISTEFDEYRRILDDKDRIYQQVVEKSK